MSEAYDSSGRDCMDIDASGGLAPPSVSTTTLKHTLSSSPTAILVRLNSISASHSLCLYNNTNNNINLIV